MRTKIIWGYSIAEFYDALCWRLQPYAASWPLEVYRLPLNCSVLYIEPCRRFADGGL